MLDAGRFPRAAQYVRGLVDGFETRPECETLVEAHEGAGKVLAERVDLEVLPDPVRHLVTTAKGKDWMPEVVGMTAEMMVADLLGEDGYRAWCYDDAMELFQRPIIRHLMRLVSPTLVVMGARSRWGAIHRGSKLEAAPVRREGDRVIADSTLTFPPEHYPPLFLDALAHSFRAAIEGARGRNVESELLSHEPGIAHYRVSWNR